MEKRMMGVLAMMMVSSVTYATTIVADSVGEFSGTQGQNNWYYGYSTSSTSGFTQFPEYGYNAAFDVSGWFDSSVVGFTGLFVSSGRVQPYSDGAAQYFAIRRWAVESNGTITGISGTYQRQSGWCPDGLGTDFLIYVNGTQVYFNRVGPTVTGTYDITTPYSVHTGDWVEFVVGPAGDWNYAYEGDYFDYTATITMVPEPVTVVLLGLGGLGMVRRKKFRF